MNFTAVNEGIGSFQLCVRIFTDASLLPTHTDFSFSLNLESVPGSAGSYIVQIIVNNLKTCNFMFPFQIPVTISKSAHLKILSCLSPLTLPLTDSVSMSPSSMTAFSKTQRNFLSVCL